jgi:hypothetical protein
MAKNRDRSKSYSRRVNTREEKKVSSIRELLTFSFKDIDETQKNHHKPLNYGMKKIFLLPY